MNRIILLHCYFITYFMNIKLFFFFSPKLIIFHHVEIVTERSNIKEITSPNGWNVQTLDLFYFRLSWVLLCICITELYRHNHVWASEWIIIMYGFAHVRRKQILKSEGRCMQVFVCYYKQRLSCLFHSYAVISPLFQLIESPITAKGRQPCSHILSWDDGRRRDE